MGRLVRSAALAAGLAVGLAAVSAAGRDDPGLAASAVQAGRVSAALTGAGGAGALAGRSRSVLLINGARLVAGPAGGARAFGVLPGAGRLGGAVLSLALGRTAFEIPWAALPYLGRGLDPGLFSVGSLRRAEAGGRLPLAVGYQGRAPSLPGVRVTHTGGGSEQGYLTLAGARAFGAALARQFAADHARGSYGQDGMFAGGVSIALPGSGAQAARAPAGLAGRAARPGAQFPMHTLTVTGTGPGGKPDTGDDVIVFNADNAGLSAGDEPFYHGVAKFSVPTGHYWAIGDFLGSAPGGGPAELLDVLPQFTVAANTTVNVRAAAADSQVKLVTPRPAVVQGLTVEFRHPTPAGAGAAATFGANFPVYVSPTTRKPTAGTLQVYTAARLFSPAKAAGAPYEYDLAYADTSGLVPAERHVVRPASLATVTGRYFSDVTGQGALLRYGLFPAQWNDLFIFLIPSVGVPRAQTEYVSGNPAVLWSDNYSQTYSRLAAGQSDVLRTFHAGERAAENWNAYPLHEGYNVDLTGAANLSPWVPSASRAGNKLTLDVTPFSDSTPGHGGNGGFIGGQGGLVDHIQGRYQIQENGKTIAAGNPLRGFKEIGRAGEFDTHVTLSAHPSTVRFALDASGAGKIFALSTASRTVWTWRSAPESGARLPAGWTCEPTFAGILHPDRACAVEPMMTLGYAVRGLSLTGSAPAGQQAVHVTAGHLPLAKAATVMRAAVLVSFNGGKTWHLAKLSGHGGSCTATFTAPANTKVSLWTKAGDAAGGSVSETIINAYQTSGQRGVRW